MTITWQRPTKINAVMLMWAGAMVASVVLASTLMASAVMASESQDSNPWASWEGMPDEFLEMTETQDAQALSERLDQLVRQRASHAASDAVLEAWLGQLGRPEGGSSLDALMEARSNRAAPGARGDLGERPALEPAPNPATEQERGNTASGSSGSASDNAGNQGAGNDNRGRSSDSSSEHNISSNNDSNNDRSSNDKSNNSSSDDRSAAGNSGSSRSSGSSGNSSGTSNAGGGSSDRGSNNASSNRGQGRGGNDRSPPSQSR